MSRIIGGFLGLMGLVALIYAGYLFQTLPDPELFDARQVSQSTKIYDRSGQTLLYELYGEQKRTIIPFREIPELVKKATLIIEDQNFYSHGGVDWRSILRALITNLRYRRVVQGGSTITQQLAKNVFLKPERTVARKIKELVLALRLEKKYTKDEVLTIYLNQIPYGSNAYGIEAAAQTYFNKSARDLEPAEVAVLVSLPKAPSYYSPWGPHKKELLARRDYVLEQLGLIEENKKELRLAPPAVGIKAPHFVLAVQDYLIEKYGEELVRAAGLKVITSLDWSLQQLAEKVVVEGAVRNEKLYQGKNAALVAQDGKTGQVLALVGSRDYFDTANEGNFNVATQGLRQPGSAIKPFAYLTAFNKGFTPDTALFDLETEFDTTGDPEKSYKPHNFDDKFRGPVTMRQALAQSINVPSVKTLYLAGLEATLAHAKKMGITTLTEKSRYGLSLALGGGEVKLIDLVNAYSVFSQDGVKHRQVFILKVEDAQGKILEEYKDQTERVIEPQFIRLINDILTDQEARRALFQNSWSLTVFPEHEVALKTGTSDDFRDAWALGYTPALVVGVWAGNNDNAPMQKQAGSILAAVPIWHAFLNEALKNYTPEKFPAAQPIFTDKAVLQGQYLINNEVHEILFYVDKKDPQGPTPLNPNNDSQFDNWEKPVWQWAEQNLGQLIVPDLAGAITIRVVSPQNGVFIDNNNLVVAAEIKSSKPLIKIELHLNDRLLDQKITGLTGEINYQNTFIIVPEIQNKLVFRVWDGANNQARKEVLFFTKP